MDDNLEGSHNLGERHHAVGAQQSRGGGSHGGCSGDPANGDIEAAPRPQVDVVCLGGNAIDHCRRRLCAGGDVDANVV